MPQNKKLIVAAFILALCGCAAQTSSAFADSIRKAYNIPELGFAVVSSTQVYELHVSGYKKINSSLPAETDDKFRIGSNTKAITGFVAALLVKQGLLSWNTKFFDLYPELKAKSNAAYAGLTLLNLLSFRTQLFPYTYTYDQPKQGQFTGDESEQRYQFTKWFLQQKPVAGHDSIHFSNLGYVAAALMLEKASGKPYKQLIAELGRQLDIQFGFGAPNTGEAGQTWGHDADLKPEPPGDNYKLSWLLAAGNIHASLPDYAKFIQLQLSGLAGHSSLLSAEEFNFLHYGLPTFAVGWFWRTDEEQQLYSYNVGNPGTFLSKVYVYKNSDRAIILFSNSQSEKTDLGLDVLFKQLYRKYIKAG